MTCYTSHHVTVIYLVDVCITPLRIAERFAGWNEKQYTNIVTSWIIICHQLFQRSSTTTTLFILLYMDIHTIHFFLSKRIQLTNFSWQLRTNYATNYWNNMALLVNRMIAKIKYLISTIISINISDKA